jgi:O-antigen/teichoic acid export membrane protein
MNKYRLLASNTALISAGNIASKVITFFMVRFYTGCLQPSDYGTADLIVLTANLLYPLITLGITDGVFRFAADESDLKKNYFSTGLYVICAGSLLFFAIVPLLSQVKEFNGYMPLIIFLTMMSALHSLCGQYIRAQGKMVLYSAQGLLNTSLVIVLNIMLLAGFHAGIIGYCISIAAADLICSIFLILKEKLWTQVIPSPGADILHQMLRYSIPLIPTSVFWWITSVSDRYMVNAMIGSQANGIYTVGNKIPTVLTLVSGAFMEAWQFSAVTEAKGNREEHIKFYSVVWEVYMSALFVVCSLVTTFSKLEIKILADSEYIDAWHTVPFLCMAMIFCAFTYFMGSVYLVEKRSGLSLYTSLIGAVVNIILNFLLIPTSLGIIGAAIATFASYFVVFLIRSWSARRLIPFDLCGIRVAVCTAILTLQVIAITFELPFYIPIQAASVVILTVINYKPLSKMVVKLNSLIKAKIGGLTNRRS